MRVILGKKQGFEAEKEVKSAKDVLDYLINERHGELVYIRYVNDANICCKEYTVRCWYNAVDSIITESGKELDWELSQKSNCKKILSFLKKDIDLDWVK